MMNERQQCLILHKANMHSLVMPNGCIEWMGYKNNGGYGAIEYTDDAGKRHCLPIHRALYMIRHKVQLRRDQYVCHKCDNPACLNDNHHWLGNAKKNNQDKIDKQRYAKKITYHHRSKKYPPELIQKAKDMLKAGDRMVDVKKATGMSQGQVYGINWGLLKKEPDELYPLSLPYLGKDYQMANKAECDKLRLMKAKTLV